MGRYRQTTARVGFGLVTIGALATWLWPNDKSVFLEDPFKIFGFVTALVVWVAAEFHTSEEFAQKTSSPNDIRVGKEILSLHRGSLRDLLKDHNTWSYIDDRAYTDVGFLINHFERNDLIFKNKEVADLSKSFIDELKKFYRFVAINTTPEIIAGRSMTGFKPSRIVNDEEYRRLEGLAREADEFANVAWERLDSLTSAIQQKIPEALD